MTFKQKHNLFKKNKLPIFVTLGIITILIIILPVTVLISKHQQETLQYAAETCGGLGEIYTCPPVPAETIGYPTTDGLVYWDGGFETGDFSKWWWTNWGGTWGNSSGTIVTDTVRYGTYAAKLTVNTPSSAGTNRAQLSGDESRADARAGKTYYYSWSMYIPSSPNQSSGWPSWTNISQWFGGCYPQVQLYINSSAHYMVQSRPNSTDTTACNPNSQSTAWDIGPIKYDQWEDFTYQISWSSDPTIGYIKVWRNGNLVLPQKQVKTLWTNTDQLGWDLQVYRDGGNTNIIYFDGSRRHDAFNTTPPPTPTTVAPTCITSNTNWQNQQIVPQNGTLEATFDATPNASGIAAVIGLSQNTASAYTDLATIAAFESNGTIDARNGAIYQAQNTVNYTPGSTYHFRLNINIPTHTYSIYVTPPGSSEITLGTNYAFRTEQTSITSLNYWATVAAIGSANICNFTINSLVSPTNTPSPTLAPLPTITPTPTSLDTIPPTITITNPINNSTIKRASTLNITANTSDNIGIKQVIFTTNNGSSCIDTTAPYTCAWSVPGKPNAIYTISAKAYDGAGNTAINTVKVNTTK